MKLQPVIECYLCGRPPGPAMLHARAVVAMNSLFDQFADSVRLKRSIISKLSNLSAFQPEMANYPLFLTKTVKFSADYADIN